MSTNETDMREGSDSVEEVEGSEAQEAGIFQAPQDHHMSSVNGNQVSVDHQQRQSIRINGASSNNNYHLPISNLPSNFRLDTHSTRTTGPLNHYSRAQSQGAAVNWNMRSPMNSPPENQLVIFDPSSPFFGQEDYSMQVYNMPQPNMSNGVGPQQMQRMRTTMGSSLPYQPNGMPPNFNRIMARGDNIPTLPAPNLQQVDWILQEQANLAQNHLVPAPTGRASPRVVMNSVYDPLYETLGLPVDPHLRMFLARRD